MRSVLFLMIAGVAVSSGLSGLLLIFNPDGGILQLSTVLLEGTPFSSFFIPGLFLAAGVGGVNTIALYLNLRRHSRRYHWAMAGGAVVCGWITGQWLLLDALHWLQFFYFGIGLLILLTAYQLMGKWAV